MSRLKVVAPWRADPSTGSFRWRGYQVRSPGAAEGGWRVFGPGGSEIAVTRFESLEHALAVAQDHAQSHYTVELGAARKAFSDAAAALEDLGVSVSFS